MQLASGTHIPDGLLAAMTLLNEKPRHGVESRNPAPHPGHEICNSTIAIGMRAGLHLEAVRESERARYYSENDARFMSPDWSAKVEPVPYAKLDDPQSLNLYAYEGNNPLAKADKNGHCWPLCTAILGAALGAVAEGASELANGQKLNGYKIGAAAAAGALAGAITGPVGDAAEAGLAIKAVAQVGASVVAGALERKLNGKTVLSKAGAKAAAEDAVAGAVGGKVEQAAEKLGATEAAQKLIPPVVNTLTDAARRAVTPDKPKPAPPPPPRHLHHSQPRTN